MANINEYAKSIGNTINRYSNKNDMKGETLKINKNGETLTITKSSIETNGQITEFEGTDEPYWTTDACSF